MANDLLTVSAVVRLGIARRFAAHPDEESDVPEDYDEPEVLQPAGTAERRADGSYLIQLTTVPLNGLLVLHPEQAADSQRG